MTATAPEKVLFQTSLEDLETSDVEGLANLRRDSKGNVFRWVKNVSGTNLVADGCCLCRFVTTMADMDKFVLSSDTIGTGPATCLVTMPAGVPITGICASGSDTGDHGWVKVAGLHKVSMRGLTTAVDQQAGCRAIATTVGTGVWGQCTTGVISGLTTGTAPRVLARGIQMAASLAAGGISTLASGIVRVNCL